MRLGLVFCLFFSPLVAQDFQAGLLGGISTSQISGDDLGGFNQVGLRAGAYVQRGFSNFNGQFEICYFEKGSREPSHENDFDIYQLKLRYLEITILLQKEFGLFQAEIGPSVAVLLHSKEQVNEDVLNRAFNRLDLSINAGVAYKLTDKASLHARFTNSLFPVRKHSSGATYYLNRGQYNTALSFCVYYRL